ncbi:terminase [Sphingomonas koreensis]|uniref:phage terminase small subunit n=1 Tax=Sphingomonas koreensis TaxID=93064 RepID=UPI000A055B35|nr:phage terminase small subunit [Sphingomonas koreensis]PJI89076.1 small terminase subunit [Sphingomonas koreensis]RSU63343.1 terminase [Sphingomonas koreensis]RSU71008.1 terminase [Sphingomonas koreensis]
MVSPFRRHQQRVHALAAGSLVAADSDAPPPVEEGTPQGQEYAALKVLLHDNLRQLSDVASIEARNPMKAEFAKAFAPWIEGAIAAGIEGRAAQDEILIQNMIWAIDYRDFDYALWLGEHALRHRLAMPERFNRTVACFLAEEIATISLDQQDAVSHAELLRVGVMIDGHDMPDPAKAKLFKAWSRSFARQAEAFDPAADNAPAGGKASYVESALGAAKRAFELDRNVGVKKDIERLERQLKELSRDGGG